MQPREECTLSPGTSLSLVAGEEASGVHQAHQVQWRQLWRDVIYAVLAVMAGCVFLVVATVAIFIAILLDGAV